MSTDIIISQEGKLQIITLNAPKRKNAISLEMYKKLKNTLQEAANDDSITITVITGNGDYFTSGNDMTDTDMSGDQDASEMAMRRRINYFQMFITMMIEYPKILVAVVNGPAIGVGVTMLPLFDVVYATDKFQTPFVQLGICPEGCSTYTFPKVLGKSLAAKMLYFNYKMSVQEAKDCGFVAQVFTQSELPSLFKVLREYSELPLKSLMLTKKMMRSPDYLPLLSVNALEIENLVERFRSEDFMNGITAFMMRKMKNKM